MIVQIIHLTNVINEQMSYKDRIDSLQVLFNRDTERRKFGQRRIWSFDLPTLVVFSLLASRLVVLAIFCVNHVGLLLVATALKVQGGNIIVVANQHFLPQP